MTPRIAATLGAIFAALGVILGAFGAHALRSRLDSNDLAVYETAVRYQMYHAFAMFAAAWMLSRNVTVAGTAAWLFVAGTVVFSGSLYLLVLTQQRWLGAVTPLGGLCFIAGWILVAVGAWQSFPVSGAAR